MPEDEIPELKKLDKFERRKGPLLFVIMDGLGIRKNSEGNAVHQAKKPIIDELEKWSKEKGLYTQIKAHGTAVGLPTDEDQGNSEVGHNALGAGQLVYQRAKLVDVMIDNGEIFETEEWQKYILGLNKNQTLHFLGLLSDGNVHSHIDQLFSLLERAAKDGVTKIRVHTLLDGRDVPPKSGLVYIGKLNEKLQELTQKYGGDYRIASGGGRMRVTMDRYESDWGVVKRGWDAHVRGIPEQYEGYQGYFKTAKQAIKTVRELDDVVNDQYLPSFVIVNEDEQPVGVMQDGDVVVNFNFRGDRAIQITRAFEEDDFDEFDKENYPEVTYLGLMLYDGELGLPNHYLVPPPKVDKTISHYLCNEGVQQFACAETHKYGHVTYFWNGNNSGYIDEQFEKYVEIQSEPSEMIAKNPKMKAKEVCDTVVEALESGKYEFLRVNIANPDMVGHTGILNAGIIAVETVDICLGRLKEVITELDGIMVVTADHGNVEEMVGRYSTSHTINPVPLYFWDPNYNNEYILNKEVEQPKLTNIAATLINLLGFEKPEEFFDSLITFQ